MLIEHNDSELLWGSSCSLSCGIVGFITTDAISVYQQQGRPWTNWTKYSQLGPCWSYLLVAVKTNTATH